MKVEQKPLEPQAMGGAYEASERFSRMMATFVPAIRSADGDVLPDKALADARSIDMIRNDAYAASGAALHRDAVVGGFFMLNAKPNTRLLGLSDDPVWEEEFQAEVEAKFGAWAESIENWPDASRRNTLTSMLRLAIGVYLVSGEVLATVEWLRDKPRPYQTAIQMIELNRLSNPGDQPFEEDRVRGGVRLNSYGAPIGYYIRRAMPSGLLMNPMDAYKWAYIPVRNRIGRPQVIHIAEQQRPGQTRGISQLVAALKTMRITQKFREVTLQNAVVNASFAAAITSELPSAQVFEALGAGNVSDSIVNYATAYLGAIQAYADGARNMMLDGVRIPHLMPGTDLKMIPLGTPGGVGQDFESSLLRQTAANLDVSYEELSRDYRETNYSSARAAMNQTGKAMNARKRMVADRFATAVYRLWFEEAWNKGDITALPRNAPSLYDGMNLEAYTTCDWIGAPRGQIDELKETQAALLRIQRGLSTYEAELSRLGHDWRQVFRQIKREKDKLTELGIDFDPADALNAASGDPRPAGGNNNLEQGGAV